MARTYYVVPKSELSKIEITATCFADINHCPTSIDGTKTIIKWDGEEPDFVSTIEGGTKYNHKQILDLLDSNEWSDGNGPREKE
jgi:hypothetical protein